MADTPMAGIEELIRAFLQRTASDRCDRGSQEDPQAEEIIFDAEVDGSRFLFIRLPKPVQLPVILSPREREIVRLVALGHSNKIIADVLSISAWTVCTHMRRIFAKLGVGSRAAMVAQMPEIRRTYASVWNDSKSSMGDSKVGDIKVGGSNIGASKTGQSKTPTRIAVSPVHSAG
jgi:DNA-binding CsgD family transcriptional regulator